MNMNEKNKKVRCAIYTRKSTEEGLEQEFNSLDAQRVAGEAYIQSQVHEGWEVIAEPYDDGGYSGGNLKRPALERLLDDVKAGKVDTIIVYKVDRLSRSLHDFAKLVELFDAHDVTFVSVTQAFNTTNSMGRLTLNILLSFAQFEREVTGERIRDKFAASKKKGIWMGGPVPLGYDLHERKLLVNSVEAEQVIYIFRMYRELRTVGRLVRHLNEQNYLTKRGKKYTKHSVRTILSNVLYIGKMSHKGAVYEGEQDALLDEALWHKVQKQRAANTAKRLSEKNDSHDALMKGKLFDEKGAAYSMTYTQKFSKRYYYYLNKATGERVAIKALDDAVLYGLSGGEIKSSLKLTGLSNEELAYRYNEKLHIIAQTAINKVILHGKQISVFVNLKVIESILLNQPIEESGAATATQPLHEMKLEVAFKSYEGRKAIFLHGNELLSHSEADQKRHERMVRLIATSFQLNEKYAVTPTQQIKEFAEQMKMDRTYLGDLLKLRYLSPEIVESIVTGKAPSHLNASMLMRTKLPRCWQQQKAALRLT